MNLKRLITLSTIAAVFICAASFVTAAEKPLPSIGVNVHPGALGAKNVPVHATIKFGAEKFANLDFDQITVTVNQSGGGYRGLPGQLVKRSDKEIELWWVIPEIKADVHPEWSISLRRAAPQTTFAWKANQNEYVDLQYDGRNVARYLCAFDSSTKDRATETYKVYHQVFDLEGQNLITKGPGGKYPHHRGIYIGWNKLKHPGGQHDFWHMKGCNIVHQKTLSQTGGPVLGEHENLIHWIEGKDNVVIEEKRRLRTFTLPAPGIALIDFETQLTAVAGDVVLDGDPEHAGFQYRPSDDVASGPKEIKAQYLFPKDLAGKAVNKEQGLPWAGLTYGLKSGKFYTVQHMSDPSHPETAVYSAYRDYGRFGQFFKTELKKGETLSLRYRILVSDGKTLDRDAMALNYQSFAKPPKVGIMVIAVKP